MTARYALYYAPEDGSALEALGRDWLGRDVRTGEAVARPTVPGIAPDRLHALTEAPRRYGFHGTMKPPFALADGYVRAELVSAIERFAARRMAFAVPALRLAELGSFLALVPGGPCADLDALAADCVRAFDPYRAPPSETELARRRSSSLSPRQERHLADWGYPYVFDDFRFHLTLTGRVPDAGERDILRAFLQPLAPPLCREPLPVASLCLFEQPDPGSPFHLTERFRFGAKS